MSGNKLTLKQQKFVDYYIKTGNATDAAIKAGYSEKTAAITGHENLRKPNVKQAIDARNKQLEDERIADIKEIKSFWTTVLRGDGNGENEWYDVKDRIKASELLAKTTGAFIEKVEHSGEINHNHNVMNKLTEDELRKLANMGGE